MRGIWEYNFPAFHEATAKLREQGWDVWSPAEREEQSGFNPKTDEAQSTAYYMRQDLPAVCESDAVIVLSGWEESVGARLEVHTALECDIPVYRYEDGSQILRVTQVDPEFNPDYVMDANDDGPRLATPEERTRLGIRQFDTGATRDTSEGKPDYPGFLSPLVVKRFGEYMLKHQVQSDGTLRSSSNWKKRIPLEAYLSSAWRHLLDWWLQHEGHEAREPQEDALCAVLFNAAGYLHEVLKADAAGT